MSDARDKERFETWFKMNYSLFRDDKDTTLKHRLWTAWQIASLNAAPDSQPDAEAPEQAISEAWSKHAVFGGPQGPFMLYPGFRDAVRALLASTTSPASVEKNAATGAPTISTEDSIALSVESSGAQSAAAPINAGGRVNSGNRATADLANQPTAVSEIPTPSSQLTIGDESDSGLPVSPAPSPASAESGETKDRFTTDGWSGGACFYRYECADVRRRANALQSAMQLAENNFTAECERMTKEITQAIQHERERAETAERERDEAVGRAERLADVICDSGPVMWARAECLDDARAWEIRAKAALDALQAELDRITSDRDAKSKRMWALGKDCDALQSQVEELRTRLNALLERELAQRLRADAAERAQELGLMERNRAVETILARERAANERAETAERERDEAKEYASSMSTCRS